MEDIVSYDEIGVKEMESRRERRRGLSIEERNTEALEHIADALYAIEDAIERIANN